MKNESAGDSPGGPAAETLCSQRKGPGSVPGRGTRARMLQLRVLRASVKTQGSQINIKKKNESVDFSIPFISHI